MAHTPPIPCSQTLFHVGKPLYLWSWLLFCLCKQRNRHKKSELHVHSITESFVETAGFCSTSSQHRTENYWLHNVGVMWQQQRYSLSWVVASQKPSFLPYFNQKGKIWSYLSKKKDSGCHESAEISPWGWLNSPSKLHTFRRRQEKQRSKDVFKTSDCHMAVTLSGL